MSRNTLQAITTGMAGIATMLLPQAYAGEWWPGNFPAYVAALVLGWLLFVAFAFSHMPSRAKPAPGRTTTHLPPDHQPSPDDLIVNWGQVTSRLPVDEAERIALDLLNRAHTARSAAVAPTDSGKVKQ
ncbi:hypothetical protein AB0F17_43160 [Nonomuraea sp. NPDC026600]|uniref:hypothetical protein n=1 Tax=Nonomuraea sp. NPDC026600 TaxID=3155363 RepID=UPI0033F5329D